MNFELNRNGNTAADLRAQFDKMHELATALDDHMANMDWYHGRNYQTCEEPLEAQRADLEQWTLARHDAHKLRLLAVSGMARVIRQREGL